MRTQCVKYCCGNKRGRLSDYTSGSCLVLDEVVRVVLDNVEVHCTSRSGKAEQCMVIVLDADEFSGHCCGNR